MKIFIHSTQKKVEQANKILKLKLKTLPESIGLSGLKLLLFALMSSGVHRLPPYKTIRGHYIHVIQQADLIVIHYYYSLLLESQTLSRSTTLIFKTPT